MTNDDIQQLFEEVREARATGIQRSEIWEKMHELAERGHSPSVDLFRSFLDDPDWDWRLQGVQLLGFHYLFPPRSEVLEKLKNLLLNDPNNSVRAAAASALGSQVARTRQALKSEGAILEIEHALLAVMESDPDQNVHYAAFDALLISAGVSSSIANTEMEEVRKSKVHQTTAYLKRILQKVGLDSHRYT